MRRQEKIKQALEMYAQSKKDIFTELHTTKNKKKLEDIISKKHEYSNKAISYINHREKDLVNKFQKIIVDGVDGCEIKAMQQFLELGNKPKYFDCIKAQHSLLLETFENSYVDSDIILDTDEGIAACHSDYFYDGVCH